MKVWNYAFLIIGLVVLFEAAGIDTGADGLKTLIGLSTGSIEFTTSAFFDVIFGIDTGILLIGLGATIISGFVLKGRLENFIILPFITGILVVFVQVFQTIITNVVAGGETWTSWLVLIILSPLAVGFIISLVEFFRGTD